jgi:hypothetical protein
MTGLSNLMNVRSVKNMSVFAEVEKAGALESLPTQIFNGILTLFKYSQRH